MRDPDALTQQDIDPPTYTPEEMKVRDGFMTYMSTAHPIEYFEEMDYPFFQDSPHVRELFEVWQAALSFAAKQHEAEIAELMAIVEAASDFQFEDDSIKRLRCGYDWGDPIKVVADGKVLRDENQESINYPTVLEAYRALREAQGK